MKNLHKSIILWEICNILLRGFSSSNKHLLKDQFNWNKSNNNLFLHRISFIEYNTMDKAERGQMSIVLKPAAVINAARGGGEFSPMKMSP